MTNSNNERTRQSFPKTDRNQVAEQRESQPEFTPPALQLSLEPPDCWTLGGPLPKQFAIPPGGGLGIQGLLG